MAHLPAAPGLDFYLLSGSVTFPSAYHPADHHPDTLPPTATTSISRTYGTPLHASSPIPAMNPLPMPRP
jgi:hypothetical protein